MTKYLDPSFSTYAPADQQYRDNWDACFGRPNTLPVRSCNLHENCDVANATAAEHGRLAVHCSDECCSDCFGD